MNNSADRGEKIFHAVLLLPPKKRAEYLDLVCSDDGALRGRVEQLLAQQSASGSLFENDPLAMASGEERTTVVNASVDSPGTMIGRYKIREKIGEGGCGIVYVAEQEEPVRRRVALKVIKLGMDTRSVIARFEAERQALAMMDHPNIAKVLDAGSTESGRPYFVMELVRGVKITEYCDQNNLSTKERLDLFNKVCQAVQHAHQKGIIHRDLKPSNILVTMHDGVPIPKVIDFGIAKATEGKLTELTVYTELYQLIGTPAYMSPEQAEMSALDIDTRSDVYSLGVLLYELLTGKTPFDAKELLQAGVDEMRRTIREKEPSRPSARLSTMAGVELTAAAKRRQIEGPRLISMLRGDLDWIVMKALEKDRTRRYETANGLAADIQRHLTNEPVSARPPSPIYKFQKAVRRNRIAYAAAGGAAVALTLGLLAALTQASRATRAEELAKARLSEAEVARKDAEEVAKFMQEIFASPDPTRDGRTITVAEMLDRMAKQLESGMKDQPEQRALLQLTLGRTYDALGLSRSATPLHEKARDYYLAALGPEHTNTLRAMHYLAVSYHHTGRLEEALKLTQGVLASRAKVNGSEHPETLHAMHNLAIFLFEMGRRDESLKLREEVLALSRRVLGPEHPDTLAAMNDLAGSYHDRGRREEAFKLREEVLALQLKVNGPEHPDTLMAMRNLAISYDAMGRRDESLKLREEVLALSRRVLGPEHPYILLAMSHLSASYYAMGRRDEWLKLREEVLELSRKVLGPEHLDTLMAMRNLAACYYETGRREEALKVQEEVLALQLKVNGPGHPVTLEAMENLAAGYADGGNRQGALKLREEIVASTRKAKGPDHADTMRSEVQLEALSGEWRRVKESLHKLIHSKQASALDYLQLAALDIHLNEIAAYEELRSSVLAGFGTNTDLADNDRAAKACLILPAAGENLKLACQLADQAAKAGPTHRFFKWFAFAKSLAEYRAGQLQGASDWAQKAISLSSNAPQIEAGAQFVLAMACQQLNQLGPAHAALKRGLELLTSKLPQPESGLSGDWHDVLIAHALMREARALAAEPASAVETAEKIGVNP